MAKLPIKREPTEAEKKMNEALANLGIKPNTKKIKRDKERK